MTKNNTFCIYIYQYLTNKQTKKFNYFTFELFVKQQCAAIISFLFEGVFPLLRDSVVVPKTERNIHSYLVIFIQNSSIAMQ